MRHLRNPWFVVCVACWIASLALALAAANLGRWMACITNCINLCTFTILMFREMEAP